MMAETAFKKNKQQKIAEKFGYKNIEECLRTEYNEKNKSVREIAEMFGYNPSTTLQWMIDLNIDRKKGGERYSRNPQIQKDLKFKRQITFAKKFGYENIEECLRTEYCDKKKGTYELSEMAGVSKGTILKWLDELGIERRPNGYGVFVKHETNKKSIKKKKNNPCILCGANKGANYRYCNKCHAERCSTLTSQPEYYNCIYCN